MGSRVGSVVLLLLLIGVAQYCQAAREGSLSTEASKKPSTNSVDNASGAINEKSSSNVNTATSKGESEDFETDDTLDEAGHIKFENLQATVQEGVLTGPAPAPSSAFSILPSLVTPAVALSLSFAVLAAKAL
ncbi:unnamed protein product [Calypogeia fissa]